MISASIFFGAISPQQVLLILLSFTSFWVENPRINAWSWKRIKEFKKATKEEEEEDQAKKEE